MNSILQCLSQTFPLTKYFLNKNNKRNISMNRNNFHLSSLYLELIENLWYNKSGSNIYNPSSLINMIENITYKNHKIEKEKYLISFILEQLNNELSPQNNGNSSENKKFNRYDKINAFKHFFNEFRKKTSIISEIFFGFKESENECLNCKRIYNSQNCNNPIYYTYEIFSYLIFPLDKIKDMENNSNNNIVTINDCFIYNQTEKKLIRSCNNCKKENETNVSSKILVGPNILIIILENKNNNPYVKLDIELTINLTNFVLKKDYNTMIYNLYGIFSHFGNDSPSPYMACCLNHIDNHWYIFNNEKINQINDIQKDFIESGTPSILFYKKQNYNSNVFNNLID